jgi:tricorn protease
MIGVPKAHNFEQSSEKATMRTALYLSALLVAAMAIPASAQKKPSAGMMRYPDISAENVVFSYAGDLWIVSREGGKASPLASPPGGERFPRFNADGSKIAFSGNYDGDTDLYVISKDGGNAQRMTWHPASESLCDWTPDGKLLFSTNGYAGLGRQPQLFTISADEPLAKRVPVPYGTNGTISDDGKWLAYTPHSRDGRTWKRYRGGMASDVWLFNLETNESLKVTDWEGTDSIPMWHGDKLYYLSDQGEQQRLNIWVYDVASKEKTQITDFEDFDCKWPSVGPGPEGKGEIIVQNGASLWIVDLATKEKKAIEITVPGDRTNLRPKRIDVAESISAGDISPKGKRLVVEARGDIWTLPAKKGTPRNLTATSGVAERMPAWSPDGQWISYFSDATGEYELYVTQSDGRGETKQLTKDGQRYRSDIQWSADSKHMIFVDNSGSIYLHSIESGETKLVDQSIVAEQTDVSWSHDSKWLVYAKSEGKKSPKSSVWVYNTEDGSKNKITNGFFDCENPTFGRSGDYIFCTSDRVFSSPQYSDVSQSFIYKNTSVILAIPLRADVERPLLPESDEVEWEKEKDEDEESDDEDSEDGDDEKDSDDDKDDSDDDEDDSDDEDEKDDEEDSDEESDEGSNPLSGTWSGTIDFDEIPEEARGFTLIINYEDGKITGEIINAMGNLDISSGTFNAETGELRITAAGDDGDVVITAKIDGDSLTGSAAADGNTLPISATRESGGDDEDDDSDGKKKDAKSKKAKPVKIEFEGITDRIFQLPIQPGQFAGLVTNDKGHLIFARVSRGRGSEGNGAGLKIFDIEDDKKAEKKIVDGISQYAITASGKKLMVRSGDSMYIISAAASQKLDKKVPTKGMKVSVNPREEWRQVFVDAWRIEREFFYDPTMHGVDWEAVRKHYEPMIDDCTSRADVGFVIGEMIAEINVGHAYYRGGRGEETPDEPVGLLGCTFEAADGHYKVGTIFEGSPWDTDAKNMLRAHNITEGQFILEVNGVELTSDQNPYAAFEGLADSIVTLTISDDATLDDDDKRIVVKTRSGDNNLRFRHWIEGNRKRIEEKTDGRVGYIYVVNTGIPGQNDLFRQYFGQLDKDALIIDDRWNGGGQIPTRFIELLNRPVTNYWAKRHGADWTWPPDSHQGPKCMLINGMAGSGGDMFPALFKQNKLGKLIGMRTWGGLVGISGGPRMIDGSAVTSPSFAYYEKDGTWGIEGHGVDPDIEVIDDPAKMVDGGDPQLDAAIEHMLEELKTNAYKQPDRPAYPDRRNIGLDPKDK